MAFLEENKLEATFDGVASAVTDKDSLFSEDETAITSKGIGGGGGGGGGGGN